MKVWLVAPLAIDTEAGTVAPGSSVALELNVTVVAAVTGALSVTLQVNCSPGSSWFASAFGTELVSGAQFKAMVGETTTEAVAVEMVETIPYPKTFDTVKAESVTLTVPAGAVANTTAATVAIWAPVGIVVVLTPARTQFCWTVPATGVVGAAHVMLLPAAVAPAPAVTVKLLKVVDGPLTENCRAAGCILVVVITITRFTVEPAVVFVALVGNAIETVDFGRIVSVTLADSGEPLIVAVPVTVAVCAAAKPAMSTRSTSDFIAFSFFTPI